MTEYKIKTQSEIEKEWKFATIKEKMIPFQKDDYEDDPASKIYRKIIKEDYPSE